MVVKLMPCDFARQVRFNPPRARLHQRDPPPIVHHVQAFTLELHRGSASVILTIDLESSNIDALSPPSAIRPFRNLSHSLAGSVIHVEGFFARCIVHYLALRYMELIFEVPFHCWQMSHAC